MDQLDTVQVTGKSRDPLEDVFGQVYAVLGQPADPMKVKDQANKFRAANAGATNAELVQMAKSEVPRMISHVLSQPQVKGVQGEEARQEAEHLANVRNATAKDRQNREFLSYGGAALSRNPEEQRKSFIAGADEPYNAAVANAQARQAARKSDLENQGLDFDTQSKGVKTREDRMKLAGSSQAALLAANANDPDSPESKAAQAAAAMMFKQLGRPQMIGQVEGMSKNQLESILGPSLDRFMKADTERANLGKIGAETREIGARTGLTGAQTRGASAEAGLKELTTKAAQKGYEETGQVPSAVEGQVFSTPDLQRQKSAQTQLDKLTEESKQRQKTGTLLNSIETQLESTRTGPMAAARPASWLPSYQKLIKDLADLEVQTGKNVGATDAARALAGQASPDISKYRSTIQSITAKMRAELQKDEILNQKLMKASQSGGLRAFNEPMERAKLKTLVGTGKGGDQVVQTFDVDDEEGIKKWRDAVIKHGGKVTVLGGM